MLGSVFSFVIMLLYIPIINKRIRNEEQVLELGLNGYVDYEKRVRYRVIPFEMITSRNCRYVLVICCSICLMNSMVFCNNIPNLVGIQI